MIWQWIFPADTRLRFFGNEHSRAAVVRAWFTVSRRHFSKIGSETGSCGIGSCYVARNVLLDSEALVWMVWISLACMADIGWAVL